MRKLIWRRLLLGLLTLWLISLIVYAAMLALPGDAAQAILGREATPERVAALRDQLNLNDSVVSQYLQWIGGVVTGSFGESAADPAAGQRAAVGAGRQLAVPRARRDPPSRSRCRSRSASGSR